MNLRFMHRVDYWAGIPLCLALSVVEGLRARFRRRRSGPPRTVLLIELSEMGSAVLAAPAIRDLVERVGVDHVWFMIFERNREGVSVLGILRDDRILTVSDRSLVAFLASLARALWRCRAERIDTAVDFEIFSRCSALITWLSGATRRSGLSTFQNEGLYRGRLFTHPVLYAPHHHMTSVYLALVGAVFAPPPGGEPLLKQRLDDAPSALPRFVATPEVDRRVDEMLTGVGPGTRLVFLNPDAGLLPLRAWPLASFAELSRRLVADEPDVTVVVVGVARTRPMAAEILAGLPPGRGLDLTGHTRSLSELVALFMRGSVLVTIDSGPAHFSGLTGIARIVLFGPETPALYRPAGDRVDICFAGLACSPCFAAANHRTSPCTDNQCLKQISPAEVLARVRARLAEDRP